MSMSPIEGHSEQEMWFIVAIEGQHIVSTDDLYSACFRLSNISANTGASNIKHSKDIPYFADTVHHAI